MNCTPGLPGGAAVQEIRFPGSAGIAGECFTRGVPINIPDAYADKRFNPEVDRRTGYITRNMLCMPITTHHGNRVGVMQILNKRGTAFGPADEDRLRALCAQAAVSIENAQFFEPVSAARNYDEGILRSMSNGVVTMDAGSTITKLNPAALGILGMGEAGLLGRSEIANEAVDVLEILRLHVVQREPGHGRTVLRALGHGHPLHFIHVLQHQAQVARIGRAPGAAPAQGIALEPVLLRHLAAALRVAGRMAVVAAGNLHQVATALDGAHVRPLAADLGVGRRRTDGNQRRCDNQKVEQ